MRMCKIVCGRKSYKKYGGFVEVMINGGSYYEEVVEQAAETLKLEEEEDSDLCLFRVDGTVIPNLDVEVDGLMRYWTLERYLKSQGKTSQQLKLGVGYRFRVSLTCVECETMYFIQDESPPQTRLARTTDACSSRPRKTRSSRNITDFSTGCLQGLQCMYIFTLHP